MKHEREKDVVTKSHETQKTTLLAEIEKVFSFFSSISKTKKERKLLFRLIVHPGKLS
jgi:hypothetical protein